MATRKSCIRRCVLFVLQAVVSLTVCLVPETAIAQLTWEFAPYDIRLWVAADLREPELAALSEPIASSVAKAAVSATGFVWKVSPDDPPTTIAADMLVGLGTITYDQIKSSAPEASLSDKIVLLAIHGGDEPGLSIRELDCATRQLGEARFVRSPQIEALPDLALSEFMRSIRPIARVERVEGNKIIARLRAGGLASRDDSPTFVPPGGLMQPVVIRTVGRGKKTENVNAPEFSYVQIESRVDTSITGVLHSGFGNVIPSKGGPKTERFILGVNFPYDHTRITLRSRAPTGPDAATAKKNIKSRPLANYEIFAKDPGQEESALVGLTDNRGSLEVPTSKSALKICYVKNGGQLLARLPIAPGHREQVTASVLDDDARLQVESYIRAMQSRVMDLVARREILAVRIKNKIKKHEFEDAKKLVGQYRALPNRSDLMRELEDARNRERGSTGITAKRIDGLFLDCQRLLTKFLDPAAGDTLARQVADAEKNPPPLEKPIEPEEPDSAQASSQPIRVADPATTTEFVARTSPILASGLPGE